MVKDTEYTQRLPYGWRDPLYVQCTWLKHRGESNSPGFSYFCVRHGSCNSLLFWSRYLFLAYSFNFLTSPSCLEDANEKKQSEAEKERITT